MNTISPTVKVIRFHLNGQPFSFHAGQYITVGLNLASSGTFKVLDGKNTIQERPFSISSNPLQKEYLEITVVGKDDGFTADYFLNHMSVGEEVDVKGPFGEFFFDESDSSGSIALIGAGSGVMPLISIASYIADKNLDMKVHMIFSFRDQKHIILSDAIEKLTQNPNISKNITLTREDWDGTTGRVNHDLIVGSGLDLKNTDFYLCGPGEFKKDMENILINECSVPIANIYT